MGTVGPDHIFVRPQREVLKIGEVLKWMKSDAYNEYLSFLETINDAVKGKPMSHPITVSPAVTKILNVLDALDRLIDETPALDQPQRFGNRAFADWLGKVTCNIDDLMSEALPENLHGALVEIPVYLIESFGNSTRIDYGSGHEMSFVMFLYCLFRIGLLDHKSDDDRIAAVTKIFNRYMLLVRKLQQTYRMEPAGSHGVYSLDDYQFVPFIWGSSQLIGNSKYDPQSFTEENTVNRAAEDYLYMACIQYILKVKTGPFYEHSNQLWNISGLPGWQKINQGLIKMYKGEVLAKFPVIQHTLFGSLFSIAPFDTSKGKPRLGYGEGACEPSRPPTGGFRSRTLSTEDSTTLQKPTEQPKTDQN